MHTHLAEVSRFCVIARSCRLLIVAALPIIASIGATGCAQTPAAPQADTAGVASADNQTEWLTSAQYQQTFNKQSREGFYPKKIEGRCENGSEQFRAQWAGIPLAVSFYSHHGMKKDYYEGKNLQYVSLGYSLEFVDKFIDCSGLERYQATWLKKQ
jgi:hypothetical protein